MWLIRTGHVTLKLEQATDQWVWYWHTETESGSGYQNEITPTMWQTIQWNFLSCVKVQKGREHHDDLFKRTLLYLRNETLIFPYISKMYCPYLYFLLELRCLQEYDNLFEIIIFLT